MYSVRSIRTKRSACIIYYKQKKIVIFLNDKIPMLARYYITTNTYNHFRYFYKNVQIEY